MPAPTSSFGRLLPCLAALFGIFVFALTANTLPAALPRVAGEFGLEPTVLARTMSVQFIAFMITTLVGGVLSDRIGKKLVFCAAALFAGLGAWRWATADGLAEGMQAAVLLGMGGGILESISSALLSDLYPERRKFLLNLAQVFYCAGAIGGPFLMSRLLPAGVSWRVFFVAIMIASVLLLLLFAYSHMPPPEAHERVEAAKLLAIVRRANFVLPCIILYCYVLSESSLGFFITTYLKQHLAAPEHWAIVALSIFWGTMMVGRMICAVLPERLSYEKLVALLCGGGMVCMMVQAWLPDWRFSIAAFACTGLAFAGAWPLIVGLTAIRNPRYSGSVIGLLVAIGALGCVTSPPLMELLFRFVPRTLVWPIAALPLGLGVVLSLVLLRIPAPPPTVAAEPAAK